MVADTAADALDTEFTHTKQQGKNKTTTRRKQPKKKRRSSIAVCLCELQEGLRIATAHALALASELASERAKNADLTAQLCHAMERTRTLAADAERLQAEQAAAAEEIKLATAWLREAGRQLIRDAPASAKQDEGVVMEGLNRQVWCLQQQCHSLQQQLKAEQLRRADGEEDAADMRKHMQQVVKELWSERDQRMRLSSERAHLSRTLASCTKQLESELFAREEQSGLTQQIGLKLQDVEECVQLLYKSLRDYEAECADLQQHLQAEWQQQQCLQLRIQELEAASYKRASISVDKSRSEDTDEDESCISNECLHNTVMGCDAASTASSGGDVYIISEGVTDVASPNNSCLRCTKVRPLDEEEETNRPQPTTESIVQCCPSTVEACMQTEEAAARACWAEAATQCYPAVTLDAATDTTAELLCSEQDVLQQMEEKLAGLISRAHDCGSAPVASTPPDACPGSEHLEAVERWHDALVKQLMAHAEGVSVACETHQALRKSGAALHVLDKWHQIAAPILMPSPAVAQTLQEMLGAVRLAGSELRFYQMQSNKVQQRQWM